MMVCNDARPKTACSSRAYSMLRAWQGDTCNGGGVVAAGPRLSEDVRAVGDLRGGGCGCRLVIACVPVRM